MAAEYDLLLLPAHDEKLQVKDLCRLRTLPHIIVPPRYVNLKSLVQFYTSNAEGDKGKKALDKASRIQGLLDKAVLTRSSEDRMMAGSGMIMAAPAQASRQSGAFMQAGAGEHGDGEGYLQQDMGYEDDGYDQPHGDHPAEIQEDVLPLVVQLEGLQVDTTKLVQADRVVGKIQIKSVASFASCLSLLKLTGWCAHSYAKVSKRVNVAKLKADLWSQIDQHLAPMTEDAASGEEEPSLSFQQLLHEAQSEERAETQQKDASLAYYFICLLHLANEKVSMMLSMMLQ
jgi:hypothetical protein